MDYFSLEILNEEGSNPCSFTFQLDTPLDFRKDIWYAAISRYSKNFDTKEDSGLVLVNFLQDNSFALELEPYARFLDLRKNELNFSNSSLCFIRCLNVKINSVKIRIVSNNATVRPKKKTDANLSVLTFQFFKAGPLPEAKTKKRKHGLDSDGRKDKQRKSAV